MRQKWTQETYSNTYRFAAAAHGDQRVPGTSISYIMHLSFVSMEVIAALPHHPDADGELAVQCAILHDVAEDTAVTSDDIRQRFGAAVASGVSALTKDKMLPTKREQMEDSLARIQQQPQEIWMVKLADRITNLAPPPHHWSKEKIRAYRREAIVIHDLLQPASQYLAARLKQKIDAYRHYE